MPSPCDNCKIRTGCDFLSFACQLEPQEIATVRPDLIKNVAVTQRLAWAENAARATEAHMKIYRMGFKRYDKRVNKSKYRARKRNEVANGG